MSKKNDSRNDEQPDAFQDTRVEHWVPKYWLSSQSSSFDEYLNRRSRMTERGLMGGQVPYIDTDEGDWEIDVGP